jgi:hypothetical protein
MKKHEKNVFLISTSKMHTLKSGRECFYIAVYFSINTERFKVLWKVLIKFVFLVLLPQVPILRDGFVKLVFLRDFGGVFGVFDMIWRVLVWKTPLTRLWKNNPSNLLDIDFLGLKTSVATNVKNS